MPTVCWFFASTLPSIFANCDCYWNNNILLSAEGWGPDPHDLSPLTPPLICGRALVSTPSQFIDNATCSKVQKNGMFRPNFKLRIYLRNYYFLHNADHRYAKYCMSSVYLLCWLLRERKELSIVATEVSIAAAPLVRSGWPSSFQRAYFWS